MTDESSLRAAVAEAAQSDDWEAFAKRMRALTAEHPDDAYVRLYHGIALEKEAETHPEAIREIKLAVELQPENPDHLTLAASHLYDLGELDVAREYVRRASELPAWSASPYAAQLAEVAGKIAADDGDDDRARKLLAAAVEGEPDDRYHARSYARFLSDRGEHGEARTVAQAGLAYHPEDEPLRDLRFRAGWFDACARVMNGDTDGLRCPDNDDDNLVADFASGSGFRDGRLYCPSCGSEAVFKDGNIALARAST